MKKPIDQPPLPAARLEIINLIDILITLIAFFLLTSVFASANRQVKITPPTAKNGTVSFLDSRPVIIGLNKEDHLFYQGQEIDPKVLHAILKKLRPDYPVVIDADRDCRFGRVVRLLDELKSSRLTKIAFTTKEKSNEGGR